MATFFRPTPFRRFIAGLLSVLLSLGPAATPAYAAVTALSDEPLATRNQSKPNILMTVDDSTSMLYDFLPDYVVKDTTYCRDGTGKMNASCGWDGASTDLTGIGGGMYKGPQHIHQQYAFPYLGFGASWPLSVGDSYPVSGPGAGCNLASSPPKCSNGVDPGPLPGIATYPAGHAYAGENYEYWSLWPAPAHSSALNKIYYNPRLTYEPPIGDDGNPLPNMNAAYLGANWTKVPADPWASPVVYVDLTAKVTVGQWCNSDWTSGLDGDASHCRNNGLKAAASNGAPTADGDYTYPWAWPGAPASKDPKYFYQNDNYLWCDATNPLFPSSGSHSQTCVGSQAQTCTGIAAQTCSGLTNQSCTMTSQTCNNSTTQTCNNISAAQTCVSSQTQTCNNIAAQTCGSSQTQTCSNIASQTCSSVNQTCGNITAQTCSSVNQTCTNFVQVCTPPDPALCTVTYTPAGCNTNPNYEGTCTASTTCPPPTCVNQGKCSVSNATCTAANAATVCTPTAGTCSGTGAACTTANAATNCPASGKCSVSNATCTAANAATVCTPTAGTCSGTGAACTTANAATKCPASGKCSVSNATCTAANAATACPTLNGTCSGTGAACTAANAATNCPPSGRCSVTNANCTAANAATACPTLNGSCSGTGAACTAANAATNCPSTGRCSTTNVICTAANAATACPTINGTCSITNAACTAANAASKCPAQGTCSATGVACTAANAATKCPAQGTGTCSGTGASCTSANAATNCPAQGKCSISTTTTCTAANAATVCLPTAGTCSLSGVACTTANAATKCPAITEPQATNCGTKILFSTSTLLDDANLNGDICRRNNKAYAGVTADRFNYPSGKYTTKVAWSGSAADNACKPSPRYAAVPRHYWRTSIEWCDKAIGTAGDKWIGFGTATGGSCQSFRDSTHVYPRYYKFGADPGTDNVTTPAFERIDLDITKRSTATFTHTWKDAQGNTETITRTFDGATPDVSEMTNYANWFAYYRTRIQAVKSVTSLAFNDLTPGTDYRVGFHTLSNTPTTTFQNIAVFDTTQRKAWVQKLFGTSIALNKDTPNLEAMVRVGEYFANGGSGDLAGSTDPIVLSCQKNWHMLFTDGITNQQKVPTKDVKNMDKLVPALPVAVVSIPALVPGQPWPPLFIEGSATATNNSAADYATYYWVTDLRTSGANEKNNVPGGDSDPATWQHLNFAALSLGTEGKLAAGNQSDTEKQLAAGSLEWSQPFPSVNTPDESGVDDLWHAAINGRGRFVNAKSAEELRAGMGAILADIANQPGTRAGAGLTGVKLSGTSNYVYRVGFDKGWSGSLIKVQIDAKTGKETPIWSAADQLTTQVTKTATSPEPWFTNRNVVTRDETGKAQPFLWDKLPNLQNSFAPGKPTRGKALVAYLRGSSENEGTEAGMFRPRAKALGDIVDGSPVYVGAPNFPYKEIYDPGYPAWKASVTRPAMIYVGANDGMLHAFNDASGGESWAYVPSALYRKPDPPESVGATYPNLLGALAFQEGALPKFKHRFLVDGPITVTDANIAGSWKTVLVGGLGKGGKSFYAVDVTDPGNVKTEADAAAALMWEFNDPDLGYSFGKPLITKTNAFGKKWLVVVSSGYNNPSGEGKLWFLDAKDGTVLKVLSTGVGSAGTPSGLAQFSAYTQDQTNYLADQIYAGDLLGNFWRFDVSDADSGNWKVEKMATLTSPSGVAQPVTTAPQIEIDIANGVDRWVFVGTGKLLHENDLADTAVQTLYAFRDGTTLKPNPITGTKSRGDLLAVTDADGLASRPDKGWYDDLPTSPAGQRIIVAPAAALSVVAYLATYPSTDPCVTGLPATLYAREFSRGNSLLLDSGGAIIESVDLPDGGVGLDILALEKDSSSGSTDPNLVIRVEGTDKSKEGTIVKIKNPELLGAHRMSWRLIGD